MPQAARKVYEVQAPDGRIFEVEGDRPPSEAELQGIFAQMGTAPARPAHPEARLTAGGPEGFMSRVFGTMREAVMGHPDREEARQAGIGLQPTPFDLAKTAAAGGAAMAGGYMMGSAAANPMAVLRGLGYGTAGGMAGEKAGNEAGAVAERVGAPAGTRQKLAATGALVGGLAGPVAGPKALARIAAAAPESSAGAVARAVLGPQAIPAVAPAAAQAAAPTVAKKVAESYTPSRALTKALDAFAKDKTPENAASASSALRDAVQNWTREGKSRETIIRILQRKDYHNQTKAQATMAVDAILGAGKLP